MDERQSETRGDRAKSVGNACGVGCGKHNEYEDRRDDDFDDGYRHQVESGRRVISVGTTSTRTLESFVEQGIVSSGAQFTNIFIYPGGRKIQVIDGLITNFHLPESTLLMLVSAFAGYENIMKAYEAAIENRYRFFSYGDAMLII